MKKKFLTAGFALALLIGPATAETSERSSTDFEQLRLFIQVMSQIREQYVEEVGDEDIIENAIRGMLSGLDPHSGYISPEAFREMQIQTRGEYGGIGIEILDRNAYLQVIAPMYDTPAERAGMKSGDLIVEIDGKPVSSYDDPVEHLRGPVDSPVVLTVVRQDSTEPLTFTLVREIIEMNAVFGNLERGNIGYVRLTTFTNEKLADDLANTIADLKAEAGGELRGLVIDLRDNPGGLLDQAIRVSDMFLEGGEIVSMRGRIADQDERWNATPGDVMSGKPIVVLANAGSASASEIVIGALQDHTRATIVGDKSFGKGIVQSVIPLGPDRALRLTTARYYTPSGASIQAIGITPDVTIREATDADERERIIREADLQGHIGNENDVAEGEEAPTILVEEGDIDSITLDYALDLIEGINTTS